MRPSGPAFGAMAGTSVWQALAMHNRVGAAEPAQAGSDAATPSPDWPPSEFDVLVIGGGITGPGVALDAASRGLRTALVEKDDFASGTSSKSSKLVHGGLRYLQQHEFRLVYENLAERQRLLDNAPHLVSPLPFLIPLFGRDGVVNRSVARVYRTALWLYDLTGGIRIGRRHEKVTQAQALAHMPTLRADRLVAGFLYWDARADDARLTLTVLRTAVLDHGAVAANHAPVTDFLVGPGRTGERGPGGPDGGQPFDVRASVVVNAAGVWADQVRALDERRDPHSIRPAKGIHITVPDDRLPLRHRRGASRCRRTAGRSSWCRGGTRSTWAPPTPSGTGRSTIRAACPRTSTTSSTRPTPSPPSPSAGRHHRAVDRAAPAAGPGRGQHAPSERTADLSRRHTVRTSAERRGHRHRGQADHLPEDGRGHRGRGGQALGRRPLRCVTKDLRLRGAGHRATPVPAGPARATPRHGATRRAGHRHRRPPGRPLRLRDPGRAGAGRRAARAARPAGAGTALPARPRRVYAVREEMACTVADVLDRRTRASLRDARGAADAAAVGWPS